MNYGERRGQIIIIDGGHNWTYVVHHWSQSTKSIVGINFNWISKRI